MKRTLLVAAREFKSVVMSKGFIIGVLMTPTITAIAIGAVVLLKGSEGPRVTGRLAVIDQSGAVADRIARRFKPESIVAEDQELSEQAGKQIDKAAGLVPGGKLDEAKGAVRAQVADRTAITVEVLSPETKIEDLTAQLATTRIAADTPASSAQLLAVAVIPPGAVRPDEAGAYQRFALYLVPRLDFEIQGRIERRIGDAVVDARVSTDPRLTSTGLSSKELRRIVETADAQSITVTSSGQRRSLGEAQFLVPMAFMILMLVSVMTTGAYLMTTVVEEKSNRVMEVLLSAVSPLELMLGKIMGHMAVGLVILTVYGGLGIAGLVVFALSGLVSPGMLALLAIYFLIASVTMASLMAAIGSAVNDMREAQTLQTPVMMLVLLPWLAWMYIQRAPNSLPVTIASFIPGLNPFVMVIRMNGSEPIPTWQYPASIVAGILGAAAAVWAAAKIFRIGVLLYGKPPNFATLIRWVRMA